MVHSQSRKSTSDVAIQTRIEKFRLHELKACLGKLGLSRKGKKTELSERLSLVFSDAPRNKLAQRAEHQVSRAFAAQVVELEYQRLCGLPPPQRPPQPHLPTHTQPSASLGTHQDTSIRCVCGKSDDDGSLMIQCEDESCGVWLHAKCVEVDEQNLPAKYFCPACCVERADPFWGAAPGCRKATLVLGPVRGREQAAPRQQEGCPPKPWFVVDQLFSLSRAQHQAIRLNPQEVQLQVCCVLLGDCVPFRCHWPTHCALMVNGYAVQVVKRSPTSELGKHSRDSPAAITMHHILPHPASANRVHMQCFDARPFAIVVQLVYRKSMSDVRARIPLPSPTAMDDCIAFTKAMSGGSSADSEDDDIVAVSSSVSFICPFGGSRIVEPARFRECRHLGCFDLANFLEVNSKARKWQCPFCQHTGCPEDLVVDVYMERILQLLPPESDDADDGVDEVVIAPDASWKPSDLPHDDRWRQPNDCTRVDPIPRESTGARAGWDMEESDERGPGQQTRAEPSSPQPAAQPQPEDDVLIILDSDSDEEDAAASTPPSHTAPPAPAHSPSPSHQQASQPLRDFDHETLAWEAAGSTANAEAHNSGGGGAPSGSGAWERSGHSIGGRMPCNQRLGEAGPSGPSSSPSSATWQVRRVQAEPSAGAPAHTSQMSVAMARAVEAAYHFEPFGVQNRASSDPPTTRPPGGGHPVGGAFEDAQASVPGRDGMRQEHSAFPRGSEREAYDTSYQPYLPREQLGEAFPPPFQRLLPARIMPTTSRESMGQDPPVSAMPHHFAPSTARMWDPSQDIDDAYGALQIPALLWHPLSSLCSSAGYIHTPADFSSAMSPLLMPMRTLVAHTHTPAALSIATPPLLLPMRTLVAHSHTPAALSGATSPLLLPMCFFMSCSSCRKVLGLWGFHAGCPGMPASRRAWISESQFSAEPRSMAQMGPQHFTNQLLGAEMNNSNRFLPASEYLGCPAFPERSPLSTSTLFVASTGGGRQGAEAGVVGAMSQMVYRNPTSAPGPPPFASAPRAPPDDSSLTRTAQGNPHPGVGQNSIGEFISPSSLHCDQGLTAEPNVGSAVNGWSSAEEFVSLLDGGGLGHGHGQKSTAVGADGQRNVSSHHNPPMEESEASAAEILLGMTGESPLGRAGDHAGDAFPSNSAAMSRGDAAAELSSPASPFIILDN